MDLPNELMMAIENRIEGVKRGQLVQDAQNISLRYRTKRVHGGQPALSSNEVMAYSVARMPATYGAIYSALRYSLGLLGALPKTLLDAGAGTGAASWAAASLLDLEETVCLEREKSMCQLGQSLMSQATGVLNRAHWVVGDILKDAIPTQADMVIASYVLNEMTDEDRKIGLLKLWESTRMLLLIVEPGTPMGYSGIIQARNLLLNNDGHVLAPCPHEEACPLEANDWCHFACRIPRSRLHRQMKGGDAPYEDEKYAYLAVTRCHNQRVTARILRHPYIEKGQVSVELCTDIGLKKEKIRKNANRLYKQARKAKWGDPLDYFM